MRNTWAPVRKASRGPFVSRLGGGFGSCPCEDVWTSAAHFQDPLALAVARRVSAQFRFVGDADQRAAWQRSTLDPHRDLAPGKVIRSCPVASFDLLTKIDPADTISASAALYLIRSKFLPLRQMQHSKYRARARSAPGPYAGSLMSEMGHERTLGRGIRDVRFTPRSGHSSARWVFLLCAISGHHSGHELASERRPHEAPAAI